nr:MAG TPA: hypothetical protein [Caudoviricetes sp.]
MTNEELRREIEQLKQIITEMRINQLESKCEPIPTSYQVKIPTDLENYYTIDIDGSIEGLYGYTNEIRVLFYLRGLAFKTKTEAEQHLKKSMLLFKMNKWAEEHADGWIPNWKDFDEEKCTVMYDNEDKKFGTYETYIYRDFTKLPVFKSEEIADQFINEFGEEIKEVFY